MMKSLFKHSMFKRCLSTSTTQHSKVPNLKLNNGVEIPQLGLGTWKATNPESVTRAVKFALQLGYNHLDCAMVYQNQREIGKAIESSGINRNRLFITSKLWNTDHRPERVRAACEQTLHELRLQHLDLYLIHWPFSFPPDLNSLYPTDPVTKKYLTEDIPLYETWEAMQELLEDGLVRSIGVSNFSETQITELEKECDIVPAVNQIEVHPLYTQESLTKFCKSKNIQITAYSPLGNPSIESSHNLLNNSLILSLAKKYGRTPAQILIKWSLSLGYICIPKSESNHRIEENFKVFDFTLEQADLDSISKINQNLKIVRPKWHSDFQ
eukprot:TRINITY_DN2844_c0_g1_i1.p1 TRINITY_DN2844_c0_g1~~TRINITY_DN2844_c0_g1_i1.p1  ORF type:complete len:325 (-),score=45.77 TRINITY_DN2844_c0_g1_i1:215-1189(-)